jgi:hypothetical protein
MFSGIFKCTGISWDLQMYWKPDLELRMHWNFLGSSNALEADLELRMHWNFLGSSNAPEADLLPMNESHDPIRSDLKLHAPIPCSLWISKKSQIIRKQVVKCKTSPRVFKHTRLAYLKSHTHTHMHIYIHAYINT